MAEGSGFAAMLGKLQSEHDREVADLRSEVARLKNLVQMGNEQAAVGSKGAAVQDPGPVPKEDNTALAIPATNTPPGVGKEGVVVAVDPAGENTDTENSVDTKKLPQQAEKKKSMFTSQSKDKGKLEKFMDGPFDIAIHLVIVASIVAFMVELAYEGNRMGADIHLAAWEGDKTKELVLEITNHVFNGIFVAEILFRFFVLRLAYVYDNGKIVRFNVFDILLVLLCIADNVILANLPIHNVDFLRVIRIIRVARAFRAVRTFEAFSALRVLFNTVLASFWALHWSMVLLAVVMLVASLVLCQSVAAFIPDEEIPLETRQWVWSYYGTPDRAMYTVFEMTFSGCWPNYARTLVEKVSPMYACFFALYIAGVVFAMFRIITALFISNTLAVANSDASQAIARKHKEKQAYAQKLLKFFHEADSSGDGFVELDEFTAILEEPNAAAYLQILELDSKEAVTLFHLLDDGDGKVSPEEFVEGALKMKGQARAQDVIALLHEIKRLEKYFMMPAEGKERTVTSGDGIRRSITANDVLDEMEKLQGAIAAVRGEVEGMKFNSKSGHAV